MGKYGLDPANFVLGGGSDSHGKVFTMSSHSQRGRQCFVFYAQPTAFRLRDMARVEYKAVYLCQCVNSDKHKTRRGPENRTKPEDVTVGGIMFVRADSSFIPRQVWNQEDWAKAAPQGGTIEYTQQVPRTILPGFRDGPELQKAMPPQAPPTTGRPSAVTPYPPSESYYDVELEAVKP